MEGSHKKEETHVVFRTVKLPAPLQDSILLLPPLNDPTLQVPSFCFNSSNGAARKPLLNIEDVRAFIRSKFFHLKPEIDHRSARRVHTGLFGIGTTGFSGSDGGYVRLSSPQASEQQGLISSHPFTEQHYGYMQDHIWNGYTQEDHSQNPHVQHSDDEIHHGSTPLLDLDDVRFNIDSFLHNTGLRRHPTTSLANRLPWYEPRASFLARGLEWPPDRFESEEAQRAYYKRARKRKPFLLGSPPLWTVTAFNISFLLVIMYNPFQKFSDFLTKLP